MVCEWILKKNECQGMEKVFNLQGNNKKERVTIISNKTLKNKGYTIDKEGHSGVKISPRIINSLRYADDTIHMAESEEELKSLLMKVKEQNEISGLKLNIF